MFFSYYLICKVHFFPESFEIEYGDYIEHYEKDAFDMPELETMERFFSASERRRLETVVSMLPFKGSAKVLDVGCGTGHLLEIMAEKGYEACGMDLGFESIRRASLRIKEKGLSVNFARGDIYRLPYRDSSFDAVIASEIVEHLENPAQALSEAARVLNPGGYFIISTPYKEKLRYTLCIHCNKKTPVNAHLHSFDEKSLRTIIESAGFSIEKEIKFSSKIFEHLGIPRMTRFLPKNLWRLMDSFFCFLFQKQSFIAMRARQLGR